MTEPTTWSDVRKRLRRDRERLRSLRGPNVLSLGILALHPSYQCIWLYRISNYFFRRNHRLLARFFWHVNLLLTGADIGPISEIGPGLVVVHPISTQIFGRLGADCTIWGHGGVGAGRSDKDRANHDIGAGPGLPVIGNNVNIGLNSMVHGSVRIGDGCDIWPGCTVIRDLPAGTTVEPLESRRRSIANSD
jgi:serine O-acetyltransferase